MDENDHMSSDYILNIKEEILSESDESGESDEDMSTEVFLDEDMTFDSDSDSDSVEICSDDDMDEPCGDVQLEEDALPEEVRNDGWRIWLPNDVSLKEFVYKNNSGFKPPLGFDKSLEISFFHLYFTDELITELVNETNRFAAEKIANCIPFQIKSMWKSWKNVTPNEFKAFLGVIINMGLNIKPEIEDYFSNHVLYHQAFFKNIFSKERFLQIFWTLHLNPPPEGPVKGMISRSVQVRNTIAYLDKKFREYYIPSKAIRIDESTVGFKGRVVIKDYNKDKPKRWALKMFTATDSANGYVCGIEPYIGKSTKTSLVRPDLLMTSRVVLTLIEKYELSYGSLKGMHVYTDRYYTSVELAQALYEKEIHLTGVINRSRKGLPVSNRKNQTLKRGQIVSYRKEDKMLFLQWMDKREVMMLSTFYDNTTEYIKRVKNGVEQVISKPKVVCRYNEHMGGVDIANHFMASYSFSRKTIKWWRKMFFWLVEVSIVNSYILFTTTKEAGVRSICQRNYRQNLIQQLVGDTKNSNKRVRPSHEVDDERLNGELHCIYELHGNKKRDCTVCSNRRTPQGRKRTKYFCKTCSNNPGLHPGKCFEKYHTNKKFK